MYRPRRKLYRHDTAHELNGTAMIRLDPIGGDRTTPRRLLQSGRDGGDRDGTDEMGQTRGQRQDRQDGTRDGKHAKKNFKMTSRRLSLKVSSRAEKLNF